MKRLITVILALALIFSLAACSGSNNGTPSTRSDSGTPSSGDIRSTSSPEGSSSENTSTGANAANASDNSSINAGSPVVQASDIVVVAEPCVELFDRDMFRETTLDGWQYKYIFSDGLIPAADYLPDHTMGRRNTSDDYRYGYLDINGTFAIAPQFVDCLPFSEGLAAAQWGGDGYWWGYIDKSGSIAIPFEYEYANSFSEGLAAVVGRNGKWGFIDTSGNVAIPFEYDKYVTLGTNGADAFSEGLAYVYNGDKFGYIDKNGSVVIPFEYDFAQSFSEGLAIVRKDGNWGYIDKTGDAVIPIEFPQFPQDGYRMLSSFHEGLAGFFAGDDGYGFVDVNGDTVIEPNGTRTNVVGYELRFSEGYAIVPSGSNSVDYIDKNGERLKLSGLIFRDSSSAFDGGVAIIAKQDSCAIININGEILAEHKLIVGLGEGYALFSDDGAVFGVLYNQAHR